MRVSRFNLLAATAALSLAACEHGTPVDSGPLNQAAFSQQISVSDFHGGLLAGTERVTIRLLRDSLVARRIIVRRAGQMTRPERVEGRVSAVASGGTADTLTFGDLGGLKVVINDSTRLHGDLDEDHDVDGDLHLALDDGPDGHDGMAAAVLTRAAFTMRLKALIAAGRRANVVARRPAPSSPQAPGDASFVAGAVRLDEGDEAAEISMNVDSANFTTNATPPPEGWITVLGLKIEVRSTTRITTDLEPTEGEIDFGGTVTSVDTTAKTVTLTDLTVVKIVAGTEIEGGEHDEDDHVPDSGLRTLAAVEAALLGGKTVTVHGEGVLESSSPRTIVAIEMRFLAGM